MECCRLLQDFILEQAIECTLVKFTENTRGVASKHLEVELPFKRTYQGASSDLTGMLGTSMMEKRLSCLCRKEGPLQGFGVGTEGLVAAALWWSSGGAARQEASSLLALSPCEVLVEESNTLPCSALTGSH